MYPSPTIRAGLLRFVETEAPVELVVLLASYGGYELAKSLFLVSKAFRSTLDVEELWHQLCLDTLKLPFGAVVGDRVSSEGIPLCPPSTSLHRRLMAVPPLIPASHPSTGASQRPLPQCDPCSFGEEETATPKSPPHITYKEHYFRNPCVPVDVKTVHMAVRRCVDGGVVTIMPGDYKEVRTIDFGMKNCSVVGIGTYPNLATVRIHTTRSNKPLFRVWAGSR